MAHMHTDNVLNLKFDTGWIHSNIKNNNIGLVLLNVNYAILCGLEREKKTRYFKI